MTEISNQETPINAGILIAKTQANILFPIHASRRTISFLNELVCRTR